MPIETPAYSAIVPGGDRTAILNYTFTSKLVRLQINPLNPPVPRFLQVGVQICILLDGTWVPLDDNYSRVYNDGIVVSDYSSYRLQIYQYPPLAGYQVSTFSVDATDVQISQGMSYPQQATSSTYRFFLATNVPFQLLPA